MLTLEIITPDAKVYSSQADGVEIPTESGEIGVRTTHIPLVTKLVAGELKVSKEGIVESIAVDHGFVKVLGDTLSVLTEAAITVSEIDLGEVESAQSRAEEALKKAELEGTDPAEVERLNSSVRYLIAQKLAKGRSRRG